MYAMAFGEEPPARRSVEQLRGIEGARVRETYKPIAKKYGVEWKALNYDTSDWAKGDIPNRCLSAATEFDSVPHSRGDELAQDAVTRKTY